MRLDALDRELDFVAVSLSQTNLENLLQHRKLVLYGGSPRFPEITLELTLESDEDHLGRRIEQMERLSGRA